MELFSSLRWRQYRPKQKAVVLDCWCNPVVDLLLKSSMAKHFCHDNLHRLKQRLNFNVRFEAHKEEFTTEQFAPKWFSTFLLWLKCWLAWLTDWCEFQEANSLSDLNNSSKSYLALLASAHGQVDSRFTSFVLRYEVQIPSKPSLMLFP